MNSLDDNKPMHNEKKEQFNNEVAFPPHDEQGQMSQLSAGDNPGAAASDSPPQAKKSKRKTRKSGKEGQAKEDVPAVQETSVCGLIYDQDKNPDFDRDDKPFVQTLKEIVTDYEVKEAERRRPV